MNRSKKKLYDMRKPKNINIPVSLVKVKGTNYYIQGEGMDGTGAEVDTGPAAVVTPPPPVVNKKEDCKGQVADALKEALLKTAELEKQISELKEKITQKADEPTNSEKLLNTLTTRPTDLNKTEPVPVPVPDLGESGEKKETKSLNESVAKKEPEPELGTQDLNEIQTEPLLNTDEKTKVVSNLVAFYNKPEEDSANSLASDKTYCESSKNFTFNLNEINLFIIYDLDGKKFYFFGKDKPINDPPIPEEPQKIVEIDDTNNQITYTTTTGESSVETDPAKFLKLLKPETITAHEFNKKNIELFKGQKEVITADVEPLNTSEGEQQIATELTIPPIEKQGALITKAAPSTMPFNRVEAPPQAPPQAAKINPAELVPKGYVKKVRNEVPSRFQAYETGKKNRPNYENEIQTENTAQKVGEGDYRLKGGKKTRKRNKKNRFTKKKYSLKHKKHITKKHKRRMKKRTRR